MRRKIQAHASTPCATTCKQGVSSTRLLRLLLLGRISCKANHEAAASLRHAPVWGSAGRGACEIQALPAVSVGWRHGAGCAGEHGCLYSVWGSFKEKSRQKLWQTGCRLCSGLSSGACWLAGGVLYVLNYE